MMVETAEFEKDILVGSYHAEPETISFNCDQISGGDNKNVMLFRPENSDIEDGISSYIDSHECTNILALDKLSDELNEKLWDDGSSEDDAGEEVIDNPSAYEILEVWKEMREDDGSFLHSELGCG